MNDTQREQLITDCLEAREKAYAPYSNFYVGAAILTTEGKVFQGMKIKCIK